MIEIAGVPVFLALLILRIARKSYADNQTKKLLEDLANLSAMATAKAMKKNSDPVEVKLNDIIIIGLITKKGDNDKEKMDIWDEVVDKYSAGIIFEKIEVNSDDNDELDAKIEKFNNSKVFKDLAEKDNIIIKSYPKEYPTMFYINKDNTIEYFKSSDFNTDSLETFIDKLLVKKSDDIISGGKRRRQTKKKCKKSKSHKKRKTKSKHYM
jgi:hypothetical protein